MDLKPKTTNKGYVPLSLVMQKSCLINNKILIEFKEGKLFVDKREIECIKFDKTYALIRGEHYTSRENAAFIRNYRQLEPSGNDNFVFILEPDMISSYDKHLIKKISGAREANVKLTMAISVNLERVWLKAERIHPIKFAIENGLDSKEIIEIVIERI